jgi:hypothetical protein
LTIYDKDEAADLTPTQKKLLRRAIEDEEAARREKRTKGFKKRGSSR